MKYLRIIAGLALAALFATAVHAQTVVRLPTAIPNSSTIVDLGNGPMELRVLQGSAQIFTSQGSGVGSVSGTAITLTATPTTPPCVGCIISGPSGITSGTLVASYNGGLIIGLSTATTFTAGSALAWGAACPSTASSPAIAAVPGAGLDLPLYTQARVCGGAQFSAGAQVLPFAIGAH